MALIKFGSVVIDGSGKLGGHVFQNSKGGMQLRTKPIPSGKPSLSQISIRSINKTLQKGWHDLTDAQRKVWNDWAVSHSIMTVRDPHKPLSGHDLWMKYNFTNLFNGDPVQHLPYGPDLPPYGPEIIKNGTFDNSSFWGIVSDWTITGGKANYLGTVVGRMYTNLVLTFGLTYKCEFDISDAAGTARIFFCRWNGTARFSPPYNTYMPISNGHYSITLVPTANDNNFGIQGSNVYGSFKLDNLSLKQIL